jgi:bleomycin hydrolase
MRPRVPTLLKKIIIFATTLNVAVWTSVFAADDPLLGKKLEHSLAEIIFCESLTTEEISWKPAITLDGKEVPVGEFDPNFKHHPRYTVELEDSDVKDQCALGTCHIQTWVSILENEYRRRTGRSISISEDYLSYRYWLEKTLALLQADDDTVLVNFGATAMQSRDFIFHNGVIPTEAWKGQTGFKQAQNTQQLFELLKNFVTRVKDRLKKLETSEQKAELIHLAEVYIRQEFKKNVGGFELEEGAFFTFEGRKFAPVGFLNTRFPLFLRKSTELIQAFDPDHPSDTIQSEWVTQVFVDTPLIEETLRQLLDLKQEVFFAFEQNNSFIDFKAGVMSIAAFNYPPFARPLPRVQRNQFGLFNGGHAVQVLGYEIDPSTKKVLKWKLKNSGGTGIGQSGYFHMYADYFKEFIQYISFYNQPGLRVPTKNKLGK